jgi:hypothetical protein
MMMLVEMNMTAIGRKALRYFMGLIHNILKGINNITVLKGLVLQLQIPVKVTCRLPLHFEVVQCHSQC